MPQLSSILDSVHPTLPSNVWEQPESLTPNLRPIHAHFITKHIYAILEHGGYTKPKEWLNLYFTGSLCTYQYSDSSDADISLFVDSDALPEWSRAEMIGLMIEGTEGLVLPGTPFEIQAYVVNRKLKPPDLFKPHLRAGYSIDEGRWISPPDHTLAHDVHAQENGFYVWAMEQADKMERLLRYEPDKAVDLWHQIHKRRMRDQVMGKGDYSESNILYKFLAKRNLLPAIAQTSGEHIAKTAVQHTLPCPNCGQSMFSLPHQTRMQCHGCGYVTPQIGWDDPESWVESAGDSMSWPWEKMVTLPPEDRSHELIDPTTRDFGPRHMGKLGAWEDYFLNKVQPIASAYASLPMLDPRALPAWQELAADSEQRANELRNRFNIQETDNPEPYANAQEMFNDINKGNFAVSRANTEHPVWTPDQNVNFRIVHDLLGHHPSGGDFSWQGENNACGSHFPMLSPNAQRALMTECLGQTGYAIANHGFGPQKVGFMDNLLTPAQQTFSSMPAGGFCHRHIRHGIYKLLP